MSCEIGENALSVDTNMDGEAFESLDQSGVQGDQPQ